MNIAQEKENEYINIIGYPGIKKKILREGTEKYPIKGAKVYINYLLKNRDDKILTKRADNLLILKIGAKQEINGLEICVKNMKLGEKSEFIIMPKYAFNIYDFQKISESYPKNASFIVVIELLKIEIPLKEISKMRYEEKLIEVEKLKEEGEIKFKLGDINKAKELFFSALTCLEDIVIDNQPKVENTNLFMICLFNLCMCSDRLKEFDEVIKFATKGLRIKQFPELIYFRGIAHANKYEIKAANEDLKILKNLLKEQKNTDKRLKDLINLIEKKQNQINIIIKEAKSFYSIIDNKRFILIYNNNKRPDYIQIFGESFIKNKNNYKKCRIIYKNKILSLTENIQVLNEKKETIKIELLIFNNILNLKGMFSKCNSLIKFYDSSQKEIYKESNFNFESKESKDKDKIIATDMSFMFNECFSLKSLPDISKWNTVRVKLMNNMFYECYSLKFIPDISKWNVSNAINTSYMFYKCSSLEFLPDISLWNMHNVTDARYMFAGCTSLSILPNIKMWDLQNAKGSISTIIEGLELSHIYIKNGIALLPKKKDEICINEDKKKVIVRK